MKILLVNTSEKTGGAAVATHRLMEALNNSGEKAKMLVRDKQSDDISVVSLRKSLLHKWYFLWERWCIFWHLQFSKHQLFAIDIANAGTDITSLPEFKEADIIHLSWINQGMLSLNSIRKIVLSGKPVVWTMHDLWPATAICHYARGCKQFRTSCHHCRLLPGGGGSADLSNKVWRRKQRAFQGGNIHFVACSKWLERQARESGLLKEHHVTSIPNPIDTRVFCPADKKAARRRLNLPEEGRIILFVSQRVTDERKGMSYLADAIERLVEQQPEWKTGTHVVVMGGHSDALSGRLSLPVHSLGYIGDEKTMVAAYRSADVFVLPSLEDNLPNTIMEAMACGTPCVGFNVGGIPEEIDHRKNGYVADYMNVDDLARGIRWVLQEADGEMLSKQAVRKVALSYSQNSVALRYIEVYSQALAFKKYKI
ncbi:MAG: glycosyltransferase family 4 protein [Prevotellaceae bacterium]|nr:glycosyltransferase family 4 protein [Prevotellaceae bacterium]MDY3364886.1 glycosyltransferase family 4 protein [Prevotella sp.]